MFEENKSGFINKAPVILGYAVIMLCIILPLSWNPEASFSINSGQKVEALQKLWLATFLSAIVCLCAAVMNKQFDTLRLPFSRYTNGLILGITFCVLGSVVWSLPDALLLIAEAFDRFMAQILSMILFIIGLYFFAVISSKGFRLFVSQGGTPVEQPDMDTLIWGTQLIKRILSFDNFFTQKEILRDKHFESTIRSKALDNIKQDLVMIDLADPLWDFKKSFRTITKQVYQHLQTYGWPSEGKPKMEAIETLSNYMKKKNIDDEIMNRFVLISLRQTFSTQKKAVNGVEFWNLLKLIDGCPTRKEFEQSPNDSLLRHFLQPDRSGSQLNFEKRATIFLNTVNAQFLRVGDLTLFNLENDFIDKQLVVDVFMKCSEEHISNKARRPISEAYPRSQADVVKEYLHVSSAAYLGRDIVNPLKKLLQTAEADLYFPMERVIEPENSEETLDKVKTYINSV